MFYITRWCAEWPLKDSHATHGAANGHTDRTYTEMVKDKLVETGDDPGDRYSTLNFDTAMI
jgi:hypothetical protein